MKKRAAHGSSHGGVLLWAIVLLLVLELHPSAVSAATAKKKTVKCPTSCDPAKTCSGQTFDKSGQSFGGYDTSSLGTPVTRASRRSQFVSYCEMDQWLGIPDGFVKTMKAVDRYFTAVEKFANATAFLVNQTSPYLVKPPCAKVSGETRSDCVPLSQNLISQLTAGKPITSAIDLATFVGDLFCGKELEEGQKKMIPSFDDIKNQGTFVIELLGIDPAVKKAQKTCAKGEDLRAPIPSSVTRQFGTMGQVLKNLDIIAGLAVQYAQKVSGICEAIPPEYKDPPVSYVRAAPVKCFRPFLDRAVKYVQVINMELQSVSGFLVSVENDFILAALRGKGLTAKDLPKDFPASRAAACRAGYGAAGGSGRRLLQSGFKPQPADMSQYHSHVQARLAPPVYGPFLNSTSSMYGHSRTLQAEGSFCLAWPDLPDLNLKIPRISLKFPEVTPFSFPGLPGPIPLPDLPGLPSVNLTLPPLPWVNATIPNPFSGLNLTIPNLPGINFTFPKLDIDVPDINLDLAGYNFTLPGFNYPIPGLPMDWRLPKLPGLKIIFPELPGFPLPDPMPGFPDLPKIPLPDLGFNITIPGISGFKLSLKLPDIDIPVPGLPDFDINVPGISPFKFPGFDVSLPGFNYKFPDYDIDLPDWKITVPGISGFKFRMPSLPPLDVPIPNLPPININMPDLFIDLKIDLPGLPKPLPRLPLPDLFSGFTPPIGLPELILEYPGLPRLPDIPGFNVSLPDLLPSVDVDLTALYKALYLKLNITLDVPDLPTVNVRVLLKGFNFNIGDLMPRFGFSVPHIILAGMSPVPSLGSFLPSLNVNISNILDGVNIDLPSIPAVTIRLNTLLAGLTPPPSFPDLFGPITIDLSALLKNIPDLPPLPPLPPIKISLPDFLGLIPGITPPLSLSGLLPRIVVRLPALPSVSLDLWSTLKKWSISITELLQVFNINLPKIPWPSVQLPNLFLGIQPPIRLPDLLPALDINWPSLPSIPGFRIPVSMILPDIQIDLVALLKALDPRIKFPTDFPTPYYIRLPDLFAGWEINLPDLPSFGGITLPKLYISAMGLSGFDLKDLLPTVNVSLPDIFGGFNLSLPDIPALPNVTLPDLLAGLQPPLRLPDLLGDFKINLGDFIPRLNIPNMPPMPTPFLEISLKDLLPKLNIDINLDLKLPALPRIRLPKVPRVSLNLDRLLQRLNIGLKQLFALFNVNLGHLFGWFKVNLGNFWDFPKIKITLPSIPKVNLGIVPLLPPIDLNLPSFNFTLPSVNIDVPWFSVSLPKLNVDVDASAPIDAAATIIDTAAGVLRESTKLLPMIDNILTTIGWNEFKDFLEFVMGIIDLVKEQLLKTIDVIISVVDKLVSALEHVQCPKEISFVCIIQDLIQDAIKSILDAIESAIDLQGWVKKILAILPIDELMSIFSSILDWVNKLNPAGEFMKILRQKIEEWIEDFINMFVPYIDFGQFNPLNGLFCEGGVNTNGTPWPVRPGIYKKAATRVKGDPMTFVCPSDFYPVVDTAERRIWMCTQQLSVLMRLPCPVNANTKEKVSVCTVDYEKTYGDTICKRPENSGLPQGAELEAYRAMYGVDRLDGEDVFKVTYLCVPKSMSFNVIAELMQIETETTFQTNGNWASTDQSIIDFTSVARESGTAVSTVDCSGGGRLVHIELLQGPTFGGRYLWHPCLAGWLPDVLDKAAQDGDWQQYWRIRELCAWVLARDTGKKLAPETYKTNDYTFAAENGANELLGTQLSYPCMGDASSVYWVHMFGRDSPENGMNRGDNRFRYVLSFTRGATDWNNLSSGKFDISQLKWDDCGAGTRLYENNGRFWKDGDDTKRWPTWPTGATQYSFPEPSEMNYISIGRWRHSKYEFDIWNPELWCANNFPDPYPGPTWQVKGASYKAQGIYDNCDLCDSPGDSDCYTVDAMKYFVPKGNDDTAESRKRSLQARRDARAKRLTLWNDLVNNFESVTTTSQRYNNECMQSVKDCEGKPTCSLSRCLPGLLQLSCIEDLFFEADPGYSNSSRLVYIFGDSKDTKVRSAKCPEGMLLRVKLAEYGAGIYSDDATKKEALQKQCPVGSNECTFDLTKILTTAADLKGQAMRVEYVCEYPKGYNPLPATDPRNPSGAGACVRCLPGSYRTDTDAACMLCPPGTFSSTAQKGETCAQCPGGTFNAIEGQTTCNVCAEGTYSAPGAALCTPCTGNTYQNSTGADQCEPCPPGFFNGPNTFAKLSCDPCPSGTYRRANMAECTRCPVGTIANTTGTPECTACPAGYYTSALGQQVCSACPIGTYQDKAGQAGCIACPNGFYTSAAASNATSDCSVKDVPVDYDALAVKIAVQFGQGTTATGRRLLQTNPMATPAELAAAKTATLTYNVTLCTAMLRALGVNNGLAELGNGICNGGPFNTGVCGWDRGDCCEATCRPNQDMAYSCDASNLQCRDPTVIARTARGGFASVLNCTLPGKTSQVPANAPTTCPAASGTNGRGNGVCDDEFNIPACKFDDGDCCPATCKRTFIDNSCSPSLFNCRDPNGNKDTVPPTLYGLPMPEDEVFEKTFSSLSQSSALEPASEVSAGDNFPCFDGVVTITDTNIPLATKTVAQCNARVLFNIRRTWTARDAAGNTASASRLYAVVDDQDSIVLGNIVVPVASPTAALPFVRQTLSLGATAPSKTYTWTITPRPGVSGRVVTKTGGSVSVTISNTASTSAELVASAAGSNIYDIALTTAYTGCAAPVTRRNAGTLTLMVTGQPLAVLSPATASIRLSGSVTFVASQSLNPNAGTGSGITYTWVVRNAANTVVLSRPASATLSQLNILGTQLGQSRAPASPMPFTVTVTITTLTGQTATATASLSLTA